MPDSSEGGTPLSRRGFLRLLGSGIAGAAADPASPAAPSRSPSSGRRTTAARPAPTPASTPPERDLAAGLPAGGGHVVYSGPLTDLEQAALYDTSLPLFARVPAQALAVANHIGVQHPSNMCGPLAIHLLTAAQLIDPVDPKRFWLLNTREDYADRMLREVFPPDRFYRGTFRVPTSQFDFSTFPLYAGDFIVLYAGLAGTFDHVLTVTRVDAAGRAFALTNLNIGPGPEDRDQYIIDEVLLYDPARPGLGQLYDWTNRRKNARLGLTGGGGFDLWRRWNTNPDLSMSPEKLQLMLDAVLNQGGQWSAHIRRLDGPAVFEKRSTAAGHPASIIKIAVGMLLMAMVEAGSEDVRSALQHTFDGGRSYADLLKAMLTYSEEPATEQLVTLVLRRMGGEAVGALLAGWGAPHTRLVPRRSAGEDIVNLLERLYQGRALSPASTQILLGHLAEVTPGDQGRLWALKNIATDRVEIFNKRASLTDPLVVGDAGILKFTDGDGVQETYVACLLGYADGAVTYEKLESLLGDCVLTWYRAQMWMHGYRLESVQDL